ncbi:hypothetical protein [Brucella intermedia]|uniref:hypothetical protein n=1 Tax=Brucella intermedia TaxID=94625 RepID=UPI00046A612C|nr:hypothetical protein [Brucella intermedia]
MKVYALYHGWVQGEISGIQINGKNYSASQILTLEADNAAKEARIKELEADRDHQSKLSNKLNRSHAALEAKLAAAEKTLAEIDASDDLSTHSLRRIARSYLEAKS